MMVFVDSGQFIILISKYILEATKYNLVVRKALDLGKNNQNYKYKIPGLTAVTVWES